MSTDFMTRTSHSNCELSEIKTVCSVSVAQKVADRVMCSNVFQCVPINLFRLVCTDLFTLCDRSSLSPMCSNIVQLWLNLGAIMPEPSQLSPGRSYMYGVLSASINRDFRNTFIFTRFPPLYLNCLLAIYSETFYIILHFLRLGFVLCATA